MDRHPYVFKALCIRAEGIRINFVPNVFADPMYSMSLLQHGRLFEVGLRIIGVIQELHVLVSFSVATCDSALTDCDFRRNFRSTSAAGKNGSFAIKVSCIICSTLSGKRILLQRRPFDRCTVEHSVEVAQ